MSMSYQAFVELAAADPAVVGLVLTSATPSPAPRSCSTGSTADIARILAAKARLGAGEAFRDCGEWLDAYANSLRRLFAQVEAAARRAGHGEVLDARISIWCDRCRRRAVRGGRSGPRTQPNLYRKVPFL
ncbi:hypothetical protein [Nonomuraea longispora]|uniref:hypothetical protein n=1 Tax=Nonomuraea longispora TaxID=1848320 RepID=UPI001C708332|nr:hypothetical protein [Nonomuraea longispora]